jgi:catechol 2,3-dioxygenase-like lactoylglutathione lyase family enzyme
MYSTKDEETRAFLRDVLGFSSVDAGHGWLIFKAPPSELAVHPTEGEGYHEMYLMCDDIEATLAELRNKGVETGEIKERGWGRLAQISLPSGEKLGIYEPQHPMAISISG